ncbi:MAG: class I tRNA ligase family protein [Acidimicrobiales bacterium]|nr:class I tRNA ligase family protein [Acidimicrobiales bacterium]
MTGSWLLVAPAPLAGEPDQVTLVAARAASERRGADDSLVVGMLEGDLASQHAVETELAREGLDRSVLGRDAFVERVRDTEARRRDELVAALVSEGIVVDGEAGRTGREEVVRAARVAFVRLFDAGLLERAERIVDVCPRCNTVVEPSDAASVSTDVVRYSLVMGGSETPELIADMIDLELLPGVVAVAVPPDHEAVGATVRVPLGLDVPVIADDATLAPWLVTAGHNAVALDFARHHNLVPITVLDRTGAVALEGPLTGLARFAARAAASDLVAAEGAVREQTDDAVDQLRCGRCATTLVPLLGWHWFLRTRELEVAAADALREGAFVLEDVAARDSFVDRAERSDSWCLSHQVWAGEAVPAARCLDCGQLAVTAEPTSSCGKCMGELTPTDDVLDSRFIAAVWPLTIEGGGAVTLFASQQAIIEFVLPAAALGLKLAGAVPFAEVVVV